MSEYAATFVVSSCDKREVTVLQLGAVPVCLLSLHLVYLGHQIVAIRAWDLCLLVG